jgi:hypothetical protein
VGAKTGAIDIVGGLVGSGSSVVSGWTIGEDVGKFVFGAALLGGRVGKVGTRADMGDLVGNEIEGDNVGNFVEIGE